MFNMQETYKNSVEEAKFSLGSYILEIFFLEGIKQKQIAIFILADGRLALKKAGEEIVFYTIFEDPLNIVAAVKEQANKVLMGSDEGKVIEIDLSDHTTPVLTTFFDEPGAWIDAIALGPKGETAAWAKGKNVYFRDKNGKITTTAAESRVSGLAFAEKGLRIAFTHAKGVSQWYPQTSTPPELVLDKDLHFSVAFSPDGQYLLATTQGPGVHIHRFKDRAKGWMRGYVSKVRSISINPKSEWAATSGATACVLWPLKGEGPFGKEGLTIGEYHAPSTCVRFHPGGAIIAVGYEDGRIYIGSLADKRGYEYEKGKGEDVRDQAITALAWDKYGNYIAYGTQSGDAKIIYVKTE